MRANKKQTALAVTLTLTTLAASLVNAETQLSELTIHPKEFTSFVRNFNPYLGSTHLHTTWDFIYEPLIIFNEMKGNAPVFRLAEAYTMSEDLTSVTFTIRKGITWSDGEAFDANDVLYSFQLVNHHPELDQSGINAWVTSIKKLNSYQITFYLKEANSNAPYEISKVPIVPQHIWENIQDPTAFSNPEPVGTGPFTDITTFTSQLYIQCRNPHYWDAANLDVDCLRVPQIASNDQFLSKIIKGEMDWTSSFIPDVDRTYAAASPNHQYWYPPAGTQAFVINFKHPNPAKKETLTNLDFRRAFSMALDRQTIIDIAFYGSGTINDFASGLGYAFETWSDENVHNKYKYFNTYNVKGAKTLLTNAGFIDINQDGFVETPSGQPLELILQSPNGWTDFNNTVQLAVEQLAEVGIKAKARTPDFSVYNQTMLDATYDIAYTNYFHGADPFTYWNSAFNSRLQSGEGMPRFAMHFYKNKQLDDLLNRFYKTNNREKQLDIAHDIQRIIAAEQVTIPVMSGAYMYQYNTTRFTGWWNEENAKGRPNIWSGIPERLLHVLDLEPIL
ncbi:ABC transporter substrate-binding protein [Vibrio ostreicida]|uniref:ABC transporter substrate-binding protein n=1 Tax=Vibrio ostreicida TaxID=526588 RepID=A0ABT8BQ94_9VIBR|nr:ABC transporter substrate-binding protein [Vibrio ostreicida]MDN3609093.1 ABC transporter substrate-binding protein [Vibrio ostreicida]NPD07989.1 ABC transporter substrate-binding protein [Vibrio ostreicida]